jgi:hypothetical protein
VTRLDTLLLTSLALTFAAVLREPPGLLGQATVLLLTAWSLAHLGLRTGLWLTQGKTPGCGWCEALMGGFAIITAAGLIEMPAGPLTAVLVLYAVSVLATALLHRLEPLRSIALSVARMQHEVVADATVPCCQPSASRLTDGDAPEAQTWASSARVSAR